MVAILKLRERFAARQMCRGKLLWIVLLLLAEAIGTSSALAADPPTDLETIRAAVDSYAQSVKTLEGKFVQTLLPGSIPAAEPLQDLHIEGTFLVEFEHRQAFVDERKSYFLLGKDGAKIPFPIHETTAFDGTDAYSLLYAQIESPSETEVPADVPFQLTIGTGGISKHEMPLYFSGLRIFQRSTLARLLREEGVQLDGKEKVNGAECLRVVQTYNNERLFVACLDPQRDYLPRRIEIMDQHRFEISEFRKFPDATGAGDRWFPSRGRMHSGAGETRDVEITELKFNGTIDPSRFSIREEDLPDGVKVLRGSSESYTGGRQDLWDEREREEGRRIAALFALRKIPAAREFGDQPVQTIAAAVLHKVHWSAWLLATGSIALVLAKWIALRRARTR